MAIFAAGKKHKNRKRGDRTNLFFRLEWREDVNPFTKIHTGAYRVPVEVAFEGFLLAEKALPAGLGRVVLPAVHPRPDDDPDIQGLWGELSDVELKNYVFGFSSLKVLKAWFYSENGLGIIKDVGCIGVYQITSEITEECFPAYVHGKIQSIAHWKHLKRIDELSTTTKR